jgi:hypothetical protein
MLVVTAFKTVVVMDIGSAITAVLRLQNNEIVFEVKTWKEAFTKIERAKIRRQKAKPTASYTSFPASFSSCSPERRKASSHVKLSRRPHLN